jgi:hypothetical protein
MAESYSLHHSLTQLNLESNTIHYYSSENPLYSLRFGFNVYSVREGTPNFCQLGRLNVHMSRPRDAKGPENENRISEFSCWKFSVQTHRSTGE